MDVSSQLHAFDKVFPKLLDHAKKTLLQWFHRDILRTVRYETIELSWGKERNI
jgi:hypothetical protein